MNLTIRPGHYAAAICAVLCFTSIEQVRAQKYVSSTFSIGDGLPAKTVNAIVQDSNGFLWAATDGGGVARFDGSSFRVYNADRGLAETRVRCLFIGDGGQMLAGTVRGIFIYDAASDRFRQFHPDAVLSGEDIRKIGQDGRGRIWAITEKKLYCISADSLAEVKLPPLENRAYYSDLLVDGSDRVWVVGNRIYPIVISRDSIRVLRLIEGCRLPAFRSVSQIVGGSVYVCAWGGSRFYRFEDGLIKDTLRFRKDGGIAINRLISDSSGNIWLATHGQGVMRYSDKGSEPVPGNPGLNMDYVYTAFRDSEGNLWFGSNEGLLRIAPTPFLKFTEEDGLTNNKVNCIEEDDRGNIWFGTYNGGAVKWDGQRFTAKENVHRIIWDITSTSDGSLWFAEDFGYVRCSGGDCRWSTYASPDAQIVYRVFEANDGSVWLATRDTGAVQLIGDSLTYWSPRHGLPSRTVRDFAQDRKNRLWAATAGGTCYFDGQSFHTVLSGSSNALAADDAGGMWIGTDRGVFLWSDDTVIHIGREDGLISDKVSCVLWDRATGLWLGTNRGLNRIPDPSGLLSGKAGIRYYGKYEGFAGMKCNDLFKDSRGNIWVGTSEGAFRYAPEWDRTELRPPQTSITGTRIFLKDTVLSGNPILSHSQNYFTFDYAGVSQSNPEGIVYSYMLSGLDMDWSVPVAEASVTYTNLAPGDYTFKVKSSTVNGLWDESPASFRFCISPPWWNTWWAISLVAAAVLALISSAFYLVYRIRLRRMRSLYDLKRNIAADIHDEVGSTLSSISLLSNLALTCEDDGSGQLRSLLEKINFQSAAMVGNVRDIVWSINPVNDSVDRLVLRMREFAGNLLSPKGIGWNLTVSDEHPGRPMPMALRHDLLMIFKEALNNIVRHSGATDVQIRLGREKKIILMSIRDNGRGFTPHDSSGSGLPNMERRARAHSGKVEFQGQNGKGTTVLMEMNTA